MKYLSAIFTVFRKFFGLFLGGYWTWIGITIYVFYDNHEAIIQFFQSLNLIPLFQSIGTNLANSDQVILTNTEKILQGSVTAMQHTVSFHSFQYTIELEAAAYLAAFLAILGGLAYIAWYLKAFDQLMQLIFGSGSSHWAGTLILAPVLYALMVYAVRGEVPFNGVALFVENIEAVWESVKNVQLLDSSLSLEGNTSEAVNNSIA
jgi:hypothetical protein